MLNMLFAIGWSFVGLSGWSTGGMKTDDALFCLAVAIACLQAEAIVELIKIRKGLKL